MESDKPLAEYRFVADVHPLPVYIKVVATGIYEAREKARKFFNKRNVDLQIKSIEEIKGTEESWN